MPERDIPVSFVGNRKHPNNRDREVFLDGFRKTHPLFIYTGPFEEIFSRSRIVLNQTACSEVNYRCFEAMACGAALLTEFCDHGMADLFSSGVNILPPYVRNNWKHASAIAARALAVPEKLVEIAEAGRDLIGRYHLARHRAAEVADTLEGLLREKAPQRRMEELDIRRTFLAATYGMLGLDLTGRLADGYSDFFFSMAGTLTDKTAA